MCLKAQNNGKKLKLKKVVFISGKKFDICQETTFFDNLPDEPEGFKEIKNARPLLILGDMVTTDHISPAGSIQKKVLRVNIL